MFNFFLTIALIALFTIEGFARTSLNTQCTKTNAGAQIEGTNINTPYTIASVTKVFTSHWAITRLGPRYRFSTIVHITPVKKNIFDVHFEGALFPYFDKSMFQFLVGELNRVGIRFINKLTYDENFLYATDIRYNPTLAHGNGDQDVIEIMKDLRRDTLSINTGLAGLNAKALTLENLRLPAALTIRINDIQYLEKKEFQPSVNTTSLNLPSSELFRNLKEMNRNSNNYVADTFFRKLSENENYIDFILNHLLMIKPDEVNLYNGSGYPIIYNGAKVYNKASCAATLEMMADLRQSMVKSGLNLEDLLPVAGKDSIDDGSSTVTQIYGSELTTGTLIGKTGSVLDTIALAGLIITENENLFFQTSFNVDNNPDDRLFAYSKIKEWLTNVLIGDKKKSDLDSYQPKAYLPFDKLSHLRKTDNFKIRN